MHEDATQGLESPATTEKRLNRDGIRVVCRDCDFEEPRWHPDLEAFDGARHGHDLRTDHEVAYEATNDRVRTDGGQVEACPACDSSRINRRVSDRYDEEERYRCVECHATFPDPVLRPSRRPEACGYTESYHALTDADDLDDLRADGSGETVDACPECDSGRLTKHVGGMSRPIDGPLGYRCLDCKAKFDEPVSRPPRSGSPNVGNLSDAGRALLDADPDDFEIRTDGGTHFGHESSSKVSESDSADGLLRQFTFRLSRALRYWGLLKHPYGLAYARERYTMTGGESR